MANIPIVPEGNRSSKRNSSNKYAGPRPGLSKARLLGEFKQCSKDQLAAMGFQRDLSRKLEEAEEELTTATMLADKSSLSRQPIVFVPSGSGE